MAKEDLPKLDICQNCETPTPGNYCPECGQDSRDHRVALRLLVVGLWNDLFTFDNRFWHSILLLLFKPGTLTDQFVNGRRVRYIPPARMYLFISIVFFFVMSSMIKANSDVVNFTSDGDRVSLDAMPDSVQTAVMDSLRTSLPAAAGLDSNAFDWMESLPGGVEVQVEDPDQEDDGLAKGNIFGREFELEEEKILGAILNLVPKAMFFLMPIFAGLLALIYRRSRRKYIEHLVFTLHFQSFIFILLTVALLTTEFLSWVIAMLIVYIYLYLAMKRFYGQGWRKTWLKHFLLTNAYNIVFFVFITTVMAGAVYLASWAEQYPQWLGWMV